MPISRYALGTILAALTFGSPHMAGATPGATYSGTVTGVWSNPVFSGSTVNPTTFVSTPYDNAATADCSIGCPANSNPSSSGTINWGSNLGFSQIIFFGLPFADQPLDTVFQFGDLIYTNGNSALDTLIFGATLTLSFGNADITDLAANLGLATTENVGDTQQNADFIDFRPALANTFNVIEGGTAVADVFGHLTGDPMPVIDFIQLDPASFPGAGFIGTGVPVPEPMSAALLAVGLIGAGFARRRAS